MRNNFRPSVRTTIAVGFPLVRVCLCIIFRSEIGADMPQHGANYEEVQKSIRPSKMFSCHMQNLCLEIVPVGDICCPNNILISDYNKYLKNLTFGMDFVSFAYWYPTIHAYSRPIC